MSARHGQPVLRPPEERALLLLARGTLDDAQADEARALVSAGLDWAHLHHLARAHEVVPLVGRNLQRLGFAIPPDVGEALAAGRRSAAARNALLARELERVLRLLSSEDVPVMPIKGVALAEALYGDRSLRECWDIDVLVPPGEARRALGLLRADGYSAEFTERFFEALLFRTSIEYTLVRRERGFEYVVDLHWGLGWSPRDDRRASAALWAESRRVSRGGVAIHAMPPEWEVLTLAVHAARHGWRPLKWLVDVHDYCARHVLDWRAIAATARRYGWLPALKQTLGACGALLGTPAPPDVTPAMPARWSPALASPSGDPEREALSPLRVIGSASGRAAYLLRALLVPTLAERRLVRLPPGLRALYFPLRSARLAGKWGGRLLATRR